MPEEAPPKSETAETFGDWLRRCREERGLTQERLSQRSGITRQQLYMLEQNMSGSRLKTLLAIAKTLSLSPAEVLTRSSINITPDLEAELKRFPGDATWFGQWITLRREELGMSMQDCAKRVGSNSSQWQQYELPRVTASGHRATDKISKGLGVHPQVVQLYTALLPLAPPETPPVAKSELPEIAILERELERLEKQVQAIKIALNVLRGSK